VAGRRAVPAEPDLAGIPQIASDVSAHDRKRRARERLITLTRLMDAAVELPGLRTSVGLDALLGVVPVVGDVVSAGIGLYLVAQARELGASRRLQARMIGNLVLDVAIGAVPIAGDIADVFFRAHRRNLKLLQKELREPWIEGEVIERRLTR
jgi:hypothetical protein